MNDLIIHNFDGHSIEERTADGYYNATAMCKSRDKRWHDWSRQDSTDALIQAICRRTGIPVIELIQALSGQGTWVHRDVALALAMWLDPDLHAAIIGWVLEGSAPKPKHQIPDNLADALLLAGTIEKQRQEAVALIEKQKPYVDAQKRLAAATGSVSVRDAAKHLKINEREFTKLLVEDWKICYRSGPRKELRPKGEYTVARDGVKSTYGYFDLKQSDVDLGNGTTIVSLQMVVTPKGLGAIARKIGPRPGEDQGDLGF